MIWSLTETQWVITIIAIFAWFIRALGPWISRKIAEHNGGPDAPNFEFYYLAASIFGLLFGLLIGKGLDTVATLTIFEGGIIEFGLTLILTDFGCRAIGDMWAAPKSTSTTEKPAE
jgi:hypothetical protein